MPARKTAKTTVACPHCGHEQEEAPTAYSTVCKECRQYFRVQDALRPAAKAAPKKRDTRHITCFQCRTELDVPATAQSTMCKRCSTHIDLQDYVITSTVSKNFRTKGRFVIEPTGYVLNTDTIAQDVILKGRFIGKLHAEGSLEIHDCAQIKGTLTANRLVIPPGNIFAWPQLIGAHTLDLAGELQTDRCTAHTIILRPSARFFGNIEAQNLIVEEGAVLVGDVRLSKGKLES